MNFLLFVQNNCNCVVFILLRRIHGDACHPAVHVSKLSNNYFVYFITVVSLCHPFLNTLKALCSENLFLCFQIQSTRQYSLGKLLFFLYFFQLFRLCMLPKSCVFKEDNKMYIYVRSCLWPPLEWKTYMSSYSPVEDN